MTGQGQRTMAERTPESSWEAPGSAGELQKAPGELREAPWSSGKLHGSSGKHQDLLKASKKLSSHLGSSGNYRKRRKGLGRSSTLLKTLRSSGEQQGASNSHRREELQEAVGQLASNITGRMPNQKLLEQLRGARRIDSAFATAFQ